MNRCVRPDHERNPHSAELPHNEVCPALEDGKDRSYGQETSIPRRNRDTTKTELNIDERDIELAVTIYLTSIENHIQKIHSS
jgi:hypothetical protein